MHHCGVSSGRKRIMMFTQHCRLRCVFSSGCGFSDSFCSILLLTVLLQQCFGAEELIASDLKFYDSCPSRPERNNSCAHGQIYNVDENSCAVECHNASTFCQPFDGHFSNVSVFHVDINHWSALRHHASVGDRIRLSGATDVKLISRNHFIVLSFAAKEIYVFEFDWAKGKATVLAAATTHHNSSVPANGDLLDWDGKDQVLVSNLFLGSQSLYEFSIEKKYIRRITTYHAHDDLTPKQLSQATKALGTSKCHSAMFHPKHKNILVAAGSSLPYRTVFYNRRRRFRRYKIPSPAPWYPQDVVVLEDNYRLVFIVYTTTKILPRTYEVPSKKDHPGYQVEEGKTCLNKTNPMKKVTNSNFKLTLYAVDLKMRRHRILLTEHISGSHPDSMVYKDGLLYASDQLNDVVHVFKVIFHDVEDAKVMASLEQMAPITGAHMPHGVDVRYDMIVIANYGNGKVALMRLPEEYRNASRKSVNETFRHLSYDHFVPNPQVATPVINCPIGYPCSKADILRNESLDLSLWSMQSQGAIFSNIYGHVNKRTEQATFSNIYGHMLKSICSFLLSMFVFWRLGAFQRTRRKRRPSATSTAMCSNRFVPLC